MVIDRTSEKVDQTSEFGQEATYALYYGGLDSFLFLFLHSPRVSLKVYIADPIADPTIKLTRYDKEVYNTQAADIQLSTAYTQVCICTVVYILRYTEVFTY